MLFHGVITEFTKVYARLDIQRLVNRGESFYQEMMKDVVADLEKRGKYTIKCQVLSWACMT